MSITKKKMPETLYRASRCCRILGNPTAYLIVKDLGKKKKTPTQISRDLELNLSTVSRTLRHLREIDIVRYETAGGVREYWIKDYKVFAILNSLEKLVENIRKKKI